MKPPPASSPFWKLVAAGSALNVRLYRLSGGRVGGRFKGAPVMLLHHVGRRSGEHRVTPVLYLADEGRYVIVASKAGTDRHPAWYHNLMATPETEIEIGRERRSVRARVVDEQERAALWPRLVAMYGDYAEYQRHADTRRLPVIALDPR